MRRAVEVAGMETHRRTTRRREIARASGVASGSLVTVTYIEASPLSSSVCHRFIAREAMSQSVADENPARIARGHTAVIKAHMQQSWGDSWLPGL